MENIRNANFTKGIFSLYKEKYPYAERFFHAAISEIDPMEPEYSLALSYQGLVQILRNKKSGIQHCYIMDADHAKELEIQFNLACAEMIVGNRRRCITVLEKIARSRLKTKHHKLIQAFYRAVGQRKNNGKSFFKRNHLFYKCLAKMLRRKEPVKTRQIKDLINTMIETHYMNSLDHFSNPIRA